MDGAQALRRQPRSPGTADALDRERARLARDIHDGLSQRLTGILLNLEICAKLQGSDLAKSGEYLALATEIARNSLAEVRQHIFHLRAGNVDRNGLVPALSQYLEEAGRLGGIAVELDVRGQSRRLPSEVERALFLITHESVTNLQRHSAARNGTVHLMFEADGCVLEVLDGGRGFDPSSQANGFGLMGMRERAAEADIGLEVESRPRAGTRIRATWRPEDGGAAK